MSERRAAEAKIPHTAKAPGEQTKTMTPAHVTDDEAFNDPNEPSPEMAGLTIALIVGSIFVTMIVVMFVAFVYFNNFWEGPTTLILPLFV